jgi:hypothetical protein
MIATVRAAATLSSLVPLAPQRRFAGLVLDGFDVQAALTAETDPGLLEQSFDIAQRAGEKIWAERFARRICNIDRGPVHRLRLASFLASAGKCDEARCLFNDIPSDVDGELYRQVLAILDAKTGRVDQAIALFDTLPGRVPPYHPAPIVLTTAQEMIEHCKVPHTLALTAQLDKDYPGHLLIRSLRLRCHLLAGEFDSARELTQLPKRTLERAPPFERRAFIEAVADSLSLFGWINELFDFSRDSIKADPTHWSLYDHAANSARATSRDKEHAELIAAIPPNSRDCAEALSLLCRWHVGENRIEEALLLLDRIRPLSATLFLETRLYVSLYDRDQNRINDSFAACETCGIPLLGPAVAYGIHTYYYNCSPNRLRHCLARLEGFNRSAPNNVHYWQTYLRCLVALDQEARAEKLYRSLPPGLAKSAVLGPFRMFFDSNAGHHERARQGWTRHIRATRHRCVNAPSSYPKTVRLKWADTPDAVLLFVTLFNAMDYLAWFLAHYRALGVDHFFIIDNGSSDGSWQRLCQEPDVSVFSNPESFAGSAFGVLWVNHLMQRYGVGHWCFHVDIDEAFVFPGYGANRTLRELLSYCDEHEYCSVPAIELDMYPERLNATTAADPFGSSCYFDVDYVAIQSELPPYVMIQGGIRERLTGLALSMQKSPLIRMAADVRYVECNHCTTHLPVSDVSGALLHYKFVGDIKRKIDGAVARAEHFASAITYQRLDSAFGRIDWNDSLLSPHSRRYDAPATLASHGLIKSSPHWEAHRSHPQEKADSGQKMD